MRIKALRDAFRAAPSGAGWPRAPAGQRATIFRQTHL